MPSLFRFLLVIAILAGLVYGGMMALVAFVEPDQREIVQTIPPARLNRDANDANKGQTLIPR